MNVIAKKPINQYIKQYPEAKTGLLVWYQAVTKLRWGNPHDVKLNFGNASIVGDNTVVFNIKGNEYRLVVKVHYNFQRIFVRWFGTHKEYDKINVLVV